MPIDYHNPALSSRLKEVIKRVEDAELRFGRPPGSVLILPVSKTRSVNEITQVADAGFLAFGESYLQEAENKIKELAQRHLQWHFIGPIQSNKTQQIATLFDWVHSIDREKIARRLNDQRPKNLPPLNVCIQVNISDEASKSGVSPGAISALADSIIELPGIQLRGIMAIPAPSHDPDQQRQAFREIHRLFSSLQAELGSRAPMLDTLSMGMSADLEAAIAEGSTLVRIGTDIFGSRSSK
ncbi:YggS family pyridoxal phosphate-dependent enzyme [Kaarinaea lacus]